MAQTSAVTLGGIKLLISDAITESDTGSTVTVFSVPAEHYVPPQGSWVYVAEAFTGGTPSLDIGDADDADGWVDTTAITEGTVGSYADVDAAYNATGKYYSSETAITATVSASLTDGTAYAFMICFDMSNRDLAAA